MKILIFCLFLMQNNLALYFYHTQEKIQVYSHDPRDGDERMCGFLILFLRCVFETSRQTTFQLK